jgi:hypothetical protein
MKLFRFLSIIVLLISIALMLLLKPPKDVFVFPKCLSGLQSCDKNKKARLIAYFDNYYDCDFERTQLLQWMNCYEKYKQDIDFCFIVAHNDTAFFNDFTQKIGFYAPFTYDIDKCFIEKYNYKFISYLTDNTNKIIDITNPSLGKEFEISIKRALK